MEIIWERSINLKSTAANALGLLTLRLEVYERILLKGDCSKQSLRKQVLSNGEDPQILLDVFNLLFDGNTRLGSHAANWLMQNVETERMLPLVYQSSSRSLTILIQ